MTLPKLAQEAPQPPKELEAWMRKEVFSGRYIIFNSKTKMGFCTSCQYTRPILEGGKHNTKSHCMACGEEVTYKSGKLGRAGLEERARVLYFGKRGKSVYAVLLDAAMDYRPEYPVIHSYIKAVYKFNRKEQTNLICHPEYFIYTERWETRKTNELPYNQSWFGYTSVRDYAYTGNLAKAIKGTDLQYATFIAHPLWAEPHQILRILDLSAKYPATELLYKVGLYQIIRDKVGKSPGSRAINWKGTDLKSVLRINRDEIREAVRLNIDLATLDFYKTCRRKGVRISIAQAAATGGYTILAETLQKLSMRSTTEKIFRYLDKQQAVREEVSRKSGTIFRGTYGYLIRDYQDYLKECEDLGHDMTDKRILFPKDLAKAHERTTIQIKVKASGAEDAQIRAIAQKLQGVAWKKNGLLIRPAANAEEIITEGQRQNHCVGSYLPRAARGETHILLVRRTEAPEEPFYTMEYKNGQIIQCRGHSNCTTTAEVQAFIEEWLAWTKKKKKARKAA